MKRINAHLLSGIALVFVAIFSYFYFFARFPITRDVPWVPFVLLVAAVALLVMGVRRSNRKMLSSIVAVAGTGLAVLFVIFTTVATRMLPSSHGAPRVGQRAPEFALRDTHDDVVKLSSLVSSSPRGVLLIFYRGYW
jgi:hypothetical protein